MSIIKNKNIQALFVLYLLSNLLLLLNINGIYWDDWVIYNQPFDELKSMANQLTGNSHLFEPIFWVLNHIGNGVFSYRVTTFVVYFITGLFLYYILLDIKALSKNTAFYLTLLFLILPVNSARIGLCVVHYGIFMCLFFMSFWLLMRYINNQGGIAFRLLILGLFSLSFFANSLIVFYAIVLLYIVYKNGSREQVAGRRSGDGRGSVRMLFTNYFDFLCLPILFFYIKTHYFVPYGIYENYNAISWDYFKSNLIENVYLSIKPAFYKPLSHAFVVFRHFLLLALIIVGFLFWYLRSFKEETYSDAALDPADDPANKSWERDVEIIMMGLGLLFFILAIFPYAAVGKLPSLKYFSSRHMLLVPLGLAFCLYFGILLIKRKNRALAHVLLITLLASCILKNVHDQAQYLKDWFYQVALEEHYKENELIKDHSTFFFRTNVAFANSRSMQFYEHNGRLKKVFGNDQRFMGDNLNEINTFADHKPYKRYNFSSWAMSTPVVVNMIKDSKHEITEKTFIKLLFSMLTDDVLFRREVKKLITMDVDVG